MSTTHATVESTFRAESGRVMAALISSLGDFELAEDVFQEALITALETWPLAVGRLTAFGATKILRGSRPPSTPFGRWIAQRLTRMKWTPFLTNG